MYTPLGTDMGHYYDLFAICCALEGFEYLQTRRIVLPLCDLAAYLLMI